MSEPYRIKVVESLPQVAQVVGRACARDLPALKCVHAPDEFFSFFARFELARSDGR